MTGNKCGLKGPSRRLSPAGSARRGSICRAEHPGWLVGIGEPLDMADEDGVVAGDAALGEIPQPVIPWLAPGIHVGGRHKLGDYEEGFGAAAYHSAAARSVVAVAK